MLDKPDRGHRDQHAPEDSFWTRTRIDRRSVAAVTGIAYAVACLWVPEPAARRFSTATGEAATMMVEHGMATLDIWEEPDGLVSQVVHGAPDATSGPRGAYPTRAGKLSPVNGSDPRIEVRHGPDRSTVRMGIGG